MREDTPPRMSDIEDEIQAIELDHVPPDDMNDEEILEHEDSSDYDIESSDSNDDVKIDDALVTFQKHTKSVFSCDFHPNKPLCVTGCENNKVFIWHRVNGQVLQEITEHNDTVIEAHFNHDGTYLATADMAGVIFLREEQQSYYYNSVWNKEFGDMLWMHWHKKGNVLFAGTVDGNIYVVRVPSGEFKILPNGGSRCVSGDLCADGLTYFASYDDGSVKLWNIKQCTILMQLDGSSSIKHTPGETSVACDIGAPFFMSGGEEGKIIFSTISGPVGMVEVRGPVNSVAFSPSRDIRMAACGTLDSEVTIWDSNRMILRLSCEHPRNEDVTKLMWINDFTLLVATIKGNVYGYDGRTGVRIFKLSGHDSFIYTFAYDKVLNQLLTASDDKTAKVYQIPTLAL